MELAAKDATEHLDGKKEIVAWFDPAGVIDRQAAGGHHAMYMRVKFEFLTPGMQHAEEANLCAKMFGIAGNFEECFCTGSEQEIVDDFLVLQDQRSQMTRKREDHMGVLRWKKFPATFFPTFASSCLTLRAMAISTGIERDGAMSAASAFIEMPAERGGTTPCNGQEHFDVFPGNPLTASFDESVTRSLNQIGHLQRWPVHLLVLR